MTMIGRDVVLQVSWRTDALRCKNWQRFALAEALRLQFQLRQETKWLPWVPMAFAACFSSMTLQALIFWFRFEASLTVHRDPNHVEAPSRTLDKILIPHSCRTSTAMARIQVPTKGTFRCDSSTAEEAVEYLRQVSLGCLVNCNMSYLHTYIHIIGHLRSNDLICRDRMVR